MSNPYQPPKSTLLKGDAGELQLQRYKNHVILEPESVWPQRCLKCNAPTDYKKKTNLVYVNPWIYLSILINVLVTIILALIFQKRFALDLPLCEFHRERRRRFVIAQWSALAFFVVMLGAGIATETPAVMGVAGVLFLALVISALVSRLAYIVKYKDSKIWLKGAGAAFLDSLQERQ